MSLQFFAPAGVEPARDKKERDDGEVDEVSHGCFDLVATQRSFSRVKYERLHSRRVIKRSPGGIKKI
jgi:hypothetical protein